MLNELHDTTLTGDEFRNIVLKNFEDSFAKEYYQKDFSAESSNIRAQREEQERKPNARPVAASIIPRRFTFGKWMHEFNVVKQPTYTIISDVWIGSYTAFDVSLPVLGHSVNIRNCIFLGELHIQNIDCRYEISFSECVFSKGISIENVSATEITFLNCRKPNSDINISGNINISKCTIDRLIFNSCEINICRILSNTIGRELTLFNTSLFKALIRSNEIKEILINCISAESVDIELTASSIYINNEFLLPIPGFIGETKDLGIKELSCFFSEKFDKAEVIIKSLKLGTLKLDGILTSKSVLFKDLVTTNFEISDFTNNGSFSLQNIVIERTGVCSIKDSTLGLCVFNNVDFKFANYMCIVSSNMLNTTLINTFLPNRIIGKDENDYYGKREAYKQLKQLYNKQGDKLLEMNASREELHAFYKSLSFKSNFFDKLVLGLNKLSNNFGFDVKQGFGSLLIVSAFFYSVYCLLIGVRLGCDYNFTRLCCVAPSEPTSTE